MINEINPASCIDDLFLTEFSTSIITHKYLLRCSHAMELITYYKELDGSSVLASNQWDGWFAGAKHHARVYKETSQILSENISAAKITILFL